MTRDEIIRLAEQAGFKVFGDRIVAADGNCSGMATESVVRLAEIVAQAEREACAKVCESGAALLGAVYDSAGASAALGCALSIRLRSKPQPQPRVKLKP